jgi:hypothetical protein
VGAGASTYNQGPQHQRKRAWTREHEGARGSTREHEGARGREQDEGRWSETATHLTTCWWFNRESSVTSRIIFVVSFGVDEFKVIFLTAYLHKVGARVTMARKHPHMRERKQWVLAKNELGVRGGSRAWGNAEGVFLQEQPPHQAIA